MQLSPETLHALIRLIHQRTGLALTADKEYLIRHRLAPVVRSCGFAGYDDLLLRLQASASGRIQDAVIEAITTKETSFFRDLWLFEALAQEVLPALANELKEPRSVRRRIRILSAGSSTGQETYSLAMLVREFIDVRQRDCTDGDFNIVGIDISGEAVDAAKTGLYSPMEVGRGFSDQRIRRHLRRHGDGWIVDDALRRLVQFRTFNLLQPMGELGMFDLILCRNVLIYFDEATRRRVCRELSDILREGGWLVVGSAEGLHGTGVELETVKRGRAFLYRKGLAG